ncbi:LysR family transcriptional regulator [Photobacterium aquae]|uniref:LysR family transcriptional regulator n=1 Tax=Photobacterium aquae TaxID=1195763 RepID=A0A0J1GWW3_9GAMM|nr:LysR family transcriptional regulator [Photobacterium aquae]KLV04111.1 LysR family transcriptional regulator [Photobacterium aquae]
MSLTQQLALFLDVVQQGSFSKAAVKNEMDNSSLSKQIKKLETELGVRLLNRSTRSFSLTPAGEEILAQTYTLVDTLGQIRSIADSYQSMPKGMLRITSPVFFGQQYLQPVISRFMKIYPEVRINLWLDDKKNDIIADHFDLAFRIGKMADSNLVAKKIVDAHYALVASNEFVERYGMPDSPEALSQLPAVIYSNGIFNLDQMGFIDASHAEGIKRYTMQGNYKVSDLRVLMDAVRDGLGYGIIDVFFLERTLKEMGLVPLLTDYPLSNMDSGIYAVYPHRKQTMLVTEFIKAVQAYIGTPPFWLDYIEEYGQLYPSS